MTKPRFKVGDIFNVNVTKSRFFLDEGTKIQIVNEMENYIYLDEDISSKSVYPMNGPKRNYILKTNSPLGKALYGDINA